MKYEDGETLMWEMGMKEGHKDGTIRGIVFHCQGMDKCKKVKTKAQCYKVYYRLK